MQGENAETEPKRKKEEEVPAKWPWRKARFRYSGDRKPDTLLIHSQASFQSPNPLLQ